MHLLVLSAFRLGSLLRRMLCLCLNAPFGAQCFPTPASRAAALDRFTVSMHLLVLSAFRHPRRIV